MEPFTLTLLLEKIQSDDPLIRTDAWQKAGSIGPPALIPLAILAAEAELEIARAARRGMWQIVHTAGAPGAEDSRPAVIKELLELLGGNRPASVRRDILWMISELGCGKCAAAPVAAFLQDEQLREDARCSLERMPGEESVAALQAALETVPREFQLAIAHSLRVRGVEVSLEKYPCQKLVPTKKTAVKRAGAA